jgi:hypothetical protein
MAAARVDLSVANVGDRATGGAGCPMPYWT